MISKNNGSDLSVDNIFNIMHHLVDSLQVVHSVGYVHNNLKPENIMFTIHAPKNFHDLLLS